MNNCNLKLFVCYCIVSHKAKKTCIESTREKDKEEVSTQVKNEVVKRSER